jgi:hypothetical protein
MFPDYHLMSALVADHRSLLEDGARKRRFLRAGRRVRHDIAPSSPNRPDRTITAVEAVPTAAPQVVSLGRTPSRTDRAA